MLAAVVRLSLQHAKLAAGAALFLLFLGVYLLHGARVDIFPPISPTQISIVTEAPGMVSEQVEQLVTRPIEYATMGAAGVDSVRSESTQGISIVAITLQNGADPYKTRESLSQNLIQANSSLPDGAGPAHLAPLTSNAGDILAIGFTAPRLSATDLRDIVQWQVRPRLLSTPGVARVGVFGGAVRRIEVRARSGDLADSDLGFGDVIDAVHRATSVSGAGFIDTPTQRVLIDPHGQALTAADVAAGQIHVAGGAPVRIGDVSDVLESAWPANNDALIDGKPGILLNVASQFGTNEVDVTRRVDASLGLMKASLTAEGVAVMGEMNRPASFIARAVRDITLDLLAGAGLIAILLIALLRDPRAAAISFVSIPLALLGALAAMTALGWTVNMMTMGGLAVALGLVADDAVIDVENIVSRLRDAELLRGSRTQAVLLASLEVRQPVIYATLIIIFALLPVVLLNGPAGALLEPLAATIIIACIAAILIALTITPALSLLFLKHLGPQPHPEWLCRIRDGYSARLHSAWRTPWPTLIVSGATLLIAAIAVAFFTIRLLPPIHDGYLAGEFDAPASTSLAVMRDYGARMARELIADPDVRHVSQRTGRPDFGDLAQGIEHGELAIELAPGLSAPAQERARQRVETVLSAYRGLTTSVRPRLDLQVFGSADHAGASIKVFGDDLDRLDATARQIAMVLKTIPGAGETRVQPDVLSPVVRIDLNFRRLALYGLSSADVLNTVQTAFEGSRAAQAFNAGRTIDIAVTAEASVRRDPESVGDLLIRSAQGISAPLKYVANVYLTDGRNDIAHINGVRRQIVWVNPDGDASRFLRLAEAEITRRVKLPPGTYLQYSAGDVGEPSNLLSNAAISTFTVIALLLGLYADGRACVFILGSTAFAAIGGIAVVALTGGVLSLGVFMGFVALFGISMRNAILLLTQVKDMISNGRATWCKETVFAVACDRLSPIVVSACVIAAGLAPIAWHAYQPGLEILGPMVLVILGGLLTSTLMSLMLLPPAVLWLWRSTEFLPGKKPIQGSESGPAR